MIVITTARNLAGHAVCSQRPRNSSLRHGHEPREEAVAGLDVAGCRAPGGDPAAQSQIAAHATRFDGVHVNGVGFEIAFKAMRAYLNICMVARKRSWIIEGSNDVPGRLPWRRQIDIQGPFIRRANCHRTRPRTRSRRRTTHQNTTTRNNPRTAACAAHLLGPRSPYRCRGLRSPPELPPGEALRRWKSAAPT